MGMDWVCRIGLISVAYVDCITVSKTSRLGCTYISYFLVLLCRFSFYLLSCGYV